MKNYECLECSDECNNCFNETMCLTCPEDYYLDNLQEAYNEYFGSYKGYNFIKVYGWFVINTEEIVDNSINIDV